MTISLRRGALALATATVLVGGASVATAETANWDMAVTGINLVNTRAITSVVVTPSADSLPVAALAVAVTETAKIADGNPWSVQVAVSDFTQTMTLGGNPLGEEEPATISRGHVSLSGPTTLDLGSLLNLVTSTPGGGGTYAHGGSESIELYRISGQSSGTVYTNVYAAAATLNADVASVSPLELGTYRSTVTVTLGN